MNRTDPGDVDGALAHQRVTPWPGPQSTMSTSIGASMLTASPDAAIPTTVETPTPGLSPTNEITRIVESFTPPAIADHSDIDPSQYHSRLLLASGVPLAATYLACSMFTLSARGFATCADRAFTLAVAAKAPSLKACCLLCVHPLCCGACDQVLRQVPSSRHHCSFPFPGSC